MNIIINNEKHLSRIENIHIENWRKAAFNEFLKEHWQIQAKFVIFDKN